jgi:hypothetical protein
MLINTNLSLIVHLVLLLQLIKKKFIIILRSNLLTKLGHIWCFYKLNLNGRLPNEVWFTKLVIGHTQLWLIVDNLIIDFLNSKEKVSLNKTNPSVEIT